MRQSQVARMIGKPRRARKETCHAHERNYHISPLRASLAASPPHAEQKDEVGRIIAEGIMSVMRGEAKPYKFAPTNDAGDSPRYRANMIDAAAGTAQMSDPVATRQDILDLKIYIVERESGWLKWVVGFQLTCFAITIAAMFFIVGAGK